MSILFIDQTMNQLINKLFGRYLFAALNPAEYLIVQRKKKIYKRLEQTVVLDEGPSVDKNQLKTDQGNILSKPWEAQFPSEKMSEDSG